MDLDDLQQNMNTRVVFKEPRGMIRWLQLFFAILAFSTVVDFNTKIGISITCPPDKPPVTTTPAPGGITSSSSQPPPPPSSSVGPVASSSTSAAPSPQTPSSPSPSPSPAPPSSSVVPPAPPTPQPLLQNQTFHVQLVVTYPFDFSQQKVMNPCPQNNYTYSHVAPLEGSPQFFVMTGVLALIYASVSLTIYLFFSSTYDSVPVWPVADLIITGIMCLFWLLASSSFWSGVAQIKSTAVYEAVEQAICPNQFTANGGHCALEVAPTWKSLTVALVSGYTSMILWGSGMWFVYKETHFHTPRNQFGPR